MAHLSPTDSLIRLKFVNYKKVAGLTFFRSIQVFSELTFNERQRAHNNLQHKLFYTTSAILLWDNPFWNLTYLAEILNRTWNTRVTLKEKKKEKKKQKTKIAKENERKKGRIIIPQKSI